MSSNDKWALISVANKEGIVEVVKEFARVGVY